MLIRPARKEDTQAVVPLFIKLFSGFTYALTGSNYEQDVLATMSQFFRDSGNRFSYENSLVLEIDILPGCSISTW